VGSNRDWGVSPNNITLPPFAGPNAPAVVVGPDIPAALQAYYGGTVVGAIIMRTNANNYVYWAQTSTLGSGVHVGTSFNGTIAEVETIAGSGLGGSDITFGVGPGDTLLTYVDGVTVDFDTGSDLQREGLSMPRGNLMNWISQAASPVAAAGVDTTAFATGTGFTFRARRAYEVRFTGQYLVSAAATTIVQRIRLDTGVGDSISSVRFFPGITTTTSMHAWNVFCVGAANVSVSDIVITMQPTGGTCQISGAQRAPTIVKIDDVGSAFDYPTATLTL
jgi:hypothetical protein